MPHAHSNELMIRYTVVIFCTALIAGCQEKAEISLAPAAVPFVEAMQQAYEQGDWNAALTHADSASRYAPAYPEIGYTKGRILTSMRKFEEAEDVYSAALASGAEYAGLWYERGHNAFLQRKYREALDYYSAEKQLLEAWDRSAGDLENDEALPTITAQIGRTYALLGVPDSAQMAYEQALDSDSALAIAHAWYSELLDDQGNVEEALVHARVALEENPLEIEYGYRVGRLLFEMGRAEEAIPYLSRVAQFWPAHEGAALNLGRALQVTGRIQEGQAFIDRVEEIQVLQQQAMMAERAVEMFPDQPARWIELAGYMMQMGYQDRAETALNAALSLKPGDLTLQSDLANLAFARGDTTSAVARYQTLLDQDPTFAAGWLNLGVMYAMIGNKEAAREAWQTVLKHNPDDTDARTFLNQLDQ